jgi:hypothetical protein
MIGEGDLLELQALVEREGAGVVVEAIARMRKRWSVRLYRVHTVEDVATVEVDAIDQQEAVGLAAAINERGAAPWQEDSSVLTESGADAELLPVRPVPDLLSALRRLLRCPDLNLDELEEETREAIDEASAAVAQAEA